MSSSWRGAELENTACWMMNSLVLPSSSLLWQQSLPEHLLLIVGKQFAGIGEKTYKHLSRT